jgi:hypothetical protein
MKKVLAALFGLALCGCQNAMERAEMADDQSCRKIIADRNDARPDAYTQCRANFQQYRQQRATVTAGAIAGVMSAPDGPPHHWSLD